MRLPGPGLGLQITRQEKLAQRLDQPPCRAGALARSGPDNPGARPVADGVDLQFEGGHPDVSRPGLETRLNGSCHRTGKRQRDVQIARRDTPGPLADGPAREVIDRYGDVVIVTFGLGCGGPTAYHPRVFTRKLTFEGPGKGWTTRELRALVDCEPRHCVAEQSAFRAKSGRIWLAYGNLGRVDRSCISVRYSDDDALSWRPIREGFTGRIPGSYGEFSHHKSGAFSFTRYTKQDPAPRLVAFGKGIVCLWHNRRSGQGTDLHMAQFDGRRWLPATIVPYQFNKRTHFTPRLHAASVDGREVFVLSTYADGVLHYRDGVWKQELMEIPAGLSRLCLAGDKTVMLIAAFPDGEKLVKKGYLQTAPVVFRAWQRAADGTWRGPREIASVEEPISIGGALQWASFRIPRFSPPNFVPLMWVGDDHSIKVLRVPVE